MKVCFNGCSFTEGVGFTVEQRPSVIYDRLVCQELGYQYNNIAVGGSSNHLIFVRSATAIMSSQYDIVFTQWSGLNRQWFFPGPDAEFYINDGRPDYKYRDLYLNKQQKQTFEDTLRIINHDYHNIFDLIDYCKILSSLGKQHKTKVININGLVPWQNDLVNPVSNNLENSLSIYTKEILDFYNRSDAEVLNFFVRLQTKFSELDQTQWVNLFDSFMHNCVDRSPTDNHPGKQSHYQMAQKVINYIRLHKF